MDTRRHNLVNVLTTGVVVLILLSLVLFWARWFCGRARQTLLADRELLGMERNPLRLILPGLERDPNEAHPAAVEAYMHLGRPYVQGLGLAGCLEDIQEERPSPYVYRLGSEPDDGHVYYDASLGLMAYTHAVTTDQTDDNNKYVIRHVTTYAGPDGMSENPDDKIGRFFAPVTAQLHYPWLVYDRKLRRFYAIEWDRNRVRKGPQLADRVRPRPVQIGWSSLSKNANCLGLRLSDPRSAAKRTPNSQVGYTFGYHPAKAFVLNASGRIDLLDIDTLSIVGSVGWLPAPHTLFPSETRVTPEDVLAYRFSPMFSTEFPPRDYVGCAVAAVSREATAMSLYIFDPNGKRVGEISTGCEYGPAQHYGESSAQAAYYGLPGAPALTGLKYILESLHPPVLLFLSYATASRFEATAGYRSVFLLPNSFTAMAGRVSTLGVFGRFLLALAFMTLSLALAGFLAVQIVCDGARLGLSRRERILWVVATVAFGLPAYITYRLTRPHTTLVTCRNCGRRRRPDMDKCHRCGGPWRVPELTPPAWRVLDASLPVAAAPPAASEEEAPATP